jgi:AcrR family transcriptional regulator
MGAEPRRGYHHGNLRQTLVAATIQLIEARGLEGVSVREVARIAGVSPGAPFSHFPSRVALLTAVAEEAMDRLVEEIERAEQAAQNNGPIQRFRAIGVGFLRWAIANPTHFQVISNRSVVNFEGSSLRRRNDEIRTRMAALIAEAAASRLLRPGDPGHHLAAGRALVYGLARMYVDGQFPSWDLPEPDALAACEAILDQFIASITA